MSEPVPNPLYVGGLDDAESVLVADLLERVKQISEQKLRFVTATCLDQGDHFDVYYHFEDNLAVRHLKVAVGRDETLPSISGIYLAAFLVENEIKELFGVQITDIAIDYGGHLLLTEDSPPTPMAKSPNGAEPEPAGASKEA